MAQAPTMDSFEHALSQHRKVLAKYMEEWSRQQDAIFARYANGHRPLEISPRRREQNRPEMEPNAQHPRHAPDFIIDGRRVEHSSRIVEHATGVASEGFGVSFTLPDHFREQTSAEARARSLQSNSSDSVGAMRKYGTNGSMLSIDRPADSPYEKSLMGKIVESWEFNATLSLVILSNVAFMAITTDHTLDLVLTGGSPNTTFHDMGEAFFLACFFVEIVFRFAAYGKGFCLGPEWKWNVFDLLIVLSGLVDLFASVFADGIVNMSYLRLNRIFKIIKMLRVVKFYRTFKELRLIIESIIGCVKTMFWALTLLAMVLFLFSLLFVQAVTDHLSSRSPGDWHQGFMLYWGSTRAAMISLFFSTTGGEDWARVAEPLWELGWVYYSAFMVYICFYMFVVVNVLTALFVDAALSESAKDDAMIIQEHLRNKQQYINQLEALFRRMSEDESEVLTWQQFEKGMDTQVMHAFAASLDIEISDSKEFFKLISANGRSQVDIEEFVIGCMKLKGPARSIDVVSLLHRTAMLEGVMKSFTSKTNIRLKELQSAVVSAVQDQRRDTPPGECSGCCAPNPPNTTTVKMPGELMGELVERERLAREFDI